MQPFVRCCGLLLAISASAHVFAACNRDELFGDWADLDGDGRDTREEMLEEADQGGWWLGRYDGIVITDSSKADVNHVVPLCLAVDWSADAWSQDQRVQFANDKLNLIVVGESANFS